MRAHPLFNRIPFGERERIANRFVTTMLPAGARLFTRGDVAAALYIVLGGSVALIGGGESGAALLGEFSEGAVIGETAAITGVVHKATAVVTQPATIAALTTSDLCDLICDYPEILAYLSDVAVARTPRRRSARREGVHRKIIIISDTGGPCPAWFARKLADCFASYSIGAEVRTQSAGSEGDGERRRATENPRCELVAVRVGDANDASYRTACVDAAIALGRNGAPTGRLAEALKDIGAKIVLHCRLLEQGARAVALDAPWRATYPSLAVREDCSADLDRIVRHILGRSVGLVLSGGGARCAAHIGVVRAAGDVGLSFDYIVATSLSAPIGATAALGWKSHEISRFIGDLFCRRFAWRDSIYDRIAGLFRCPISNALRREFGSTLIEHSPISFGCLSVDMSSGREVFHDQGLLWEAVRASLAVPGLISPSVTDGKCHVDGAVLNNFPVNQLGLLRGAERCGTTVGVDVGRCSAPEFVTGDRRKPAPHSMWRRNPSGTADCFTPLASAAVLMRAMTLDKNGQARPNRVAVNCLIEPNVSSFGICEWSRQLELEEQGYWAAMPALMKVREKISGSEPPSA